MVLETFLSSAIEPSVKTLSCFLVGLIGMPNKGLSQDFISSVVNRNDQSNADESGYEIREDSAFARLQKLSINSRLKSKTYYLATSRSCSLSKMKV